MRGDTHDAVPARLTIKHTHRTLQTPRPRKQRPPDDIRRILTTPPIRTARTRRLQSRLDRTHFDTREAL